MIRHPPETKRQKRTEVQPLSGSDGLIYRTQYHADKDNKTYDAQICMDEQEGIVEISAKGHRPIDNALVDTKHEILPVHAQIRQILNPDIKSLSAFQTTSVKTIDDIEIRLALKDPDQTIYNDRYDHRTEDDTQDHPVSSGLFIPEVFMQEHSHQQYTRGKNSAASAHHEAEQRCT